MTDIKKVIDGLQAHADGCGYRSHYCDDMECPYRNGKSCDIEEMCHDAVELLKSQPQIVRCRECRQNNECSIQFKFAPADNPGNWFCGYGKRKEGR